MLGKLPFPPFCLNQLVWLKTLGLVSRLAAMPFQALGGYMEVSQNYGYLVKGPNHKDYSIFGSILGSPHFGKQPYRGYV